MYNVDIFINFFILITIMIIISIFGLDMKEPYPKKIIQIYNEPYVRFISYMFVYALTFYNNSIAIVGLIAVLLLHIDFINLVVTN
jgi:hypothetical protein